MRVGLLVAGGAGWIGGINYYATLSRSLVDLGHNVVAFIDPRADSTALARGGCTIVHLPKLPARPYQLIQTLTGLAGHRHPVAEMLLRRHGVDFVGPSMVPLGRRSWPPYAGWMWDFQHVELPHMFSPQERASRDRTFLRMAEEAAAVCVSSHHAAQLARRLFPHCATRLHVLRFPALQDPTWSEVSVNEVRATYGLDGPYVHFPAQFWRHKNHTTAFKAWNELGGEGPLLVCTGATEDYRFPGYLTELKSLLTNPAAAARVLVLGIVPRTHLFALYRGATAILNASLYEGWSTTVEEAKALGKPLLLSDIPLFREQAPLARFFAAEDPEGLMRALNQSQEPLRTDYSTEEYTSSLIKLLASRSC